MQKTSSHANIGNVLLSGFRARDIHWLFAVGTVMKLRAGKAIPLEKNSFDQQARIIVFISSAMRGSELRGPINWSNE